jgi:hypothetical protein
MTRKFVLEIELENAAFGRKGDHSICAGELEYILVNLAVRLTKIPGVMLESPLKVLDSNGNTCGGWRIEECESSTTDVKEPTSTKRGRKK